MIAPEKGAFYLCQTANTGSFQSFFVLSCFSQNGLSSFNQYLFCYNYSICFYEVSILFSGSNSGSCADF